MRYEFIGDINLAGRTYKDCYVTLSGYVSDPDVTAMTLDNFEGPITKATVNLVAYNEKPRSIAHAFIKNSDENEGLVLELERVGLIEPTRNIIKYGYNSEAVEVLVTVDNIVPNAKPIVKKKPSFK